MSCGSGGGAHLGRYGGHVVAEEGREPPRDRNVSVEAMTLVLRENDDLQKARIGEVREYEIDQSVDTPERHGRFGPVFGERHEALALAPGENDDEN